MELPKDFNWREYLFLNKDLEHLGKKEDLIDHYLNFGEKEKRDYKIDKYNYNKFLPKDFKWQDYYNLHKDLNLKKNKKYVIKHFLLFGKNNKYKLDNNDLMKNNDNKKNNNNKKNDNKKNDNKKNDNKKNDNKKNNDKNINKFVNRKNDPTKNTYDIYKSINIDLKINSSKKFQINQKKDNYLNDNDNTLVEKITIDNDNYDFLEEKDLIYPYIKNDKYLEFETDLDILNVLPNFNLIIDSNDSDTKDSFFINTIISKYKNYATFLILRYDNEKYYLNLNNEFLINQFFNGIDEVMKLIDNFVDKINKIFINSFILYSDKFIEYILKLPIYKITTTSDFNKNYKNSLTLYSYIDLYNKNIDINKIDELIHPYEHKVDSYNTIYQKPIKIIPFPKFNFKNIKIKTNNKQIICCIIGNINEKKGRTNLENIVTYFDEKYKNIKFVLLGTIDTKINITSEKYESIDEFNNLLIKYSPNIIIELSDYINNYSDTLNLTLITNLPIIYSSKKNESYIKEQLLNCVKAYQFENMDDLFYLINKYSQDYFYTILPVISFSKCWNDIWIDKKEKITYSTENKYNIKPFFIYYPQFHEINENNIIYYKGHNDMKDIYYYNERNNIQLNVPHQEYCPIENYNYIINEGLIQKQIDFINEYNYSGMAVYFYWFLINTITNKNLIMQEVLDKLFSSEINMYNKQIFFIWKNENLSNIYNCGNKIIENIYNSSCYNKICEDLIRYFKNERYLKIDNKPVFIVEDSNLIDNIDLFFNIINDFCIKNNFNGINLILNSHNNENNRFKSCKIHFDKNTEKNRFVEFKNNENEINYKKFTDDILNTKNIQTMIYDFNNSSNIRKHLKLNQPLVCKNNSEMLKILYTKKVVDSYNKSSQTEIDKILLVNSLNNWSDGNNFEPNEKYGYYNINLLNKLLKY
jgi:hypothetical protein